MGQRRRIGSDGIADDLFVRALLLRHGESKALIISLDLAWATTEDVTVPENRGTGCPLVLKKATLPRGVRKKWADLAGVPEGAVTLNATHTHTAPGLRPMDEHDTPANRWLRRIHAAIEDAIKRLPDALEDVFLQVGTYESPHAVYRAVPSRAWAQHFPIDRTLTAMELVGSKGPVARLVNFGVHPILSADIRKISPDFVGAAMRALDSRHPGISLYIQGFSGDIGPAVKGCYAGRTLSAEGVRWSGALLAADVEAALEAAVRLEVGSLRVAYDNVTLPIRKNATKEPMKNVNPVQIHGIKFGESAMLLSVSAEVFNDYGPMLKKYLYPRCRHVLTSGVANGYSGYLPSAAAFGRAGELAKDDRVEVEYEVDVTPFNPEAEKVLLQELGKLLR